MNNFKISGDKIMHTSNYRMNRYKYIHDWVGTETHRELCKLQGFDRANQWYMHKPEAS